MHTGAGTDEGLFGLHLNLWIRFLAKPIHAKKP